MARILIVGSHEKFCSKLQAALESAGYEADYRRDALTGQTALADRRPDLLLLELEMPGGGGIAVYRGARRKPETADLPILLLATPKLELDVWQQLESAPHPQTIVLRTPLDMRVLLPMLEARL